MTSSGVTLGGLPVHEGEIIMPRRGVWFAQLALVGSDPPPNGIVRIDDAEWRGTVSDEAGVFGLQWRGQVLGGAGAWHNMLPRRGYNNDAGVKAATVIADLARETGESLGTVSPGQVSLGQDYAREARMASESLTDAARGVPWWVARDGRTHVAPRSGPAVVIEDILDHDPHQRRLEFILDDLRRVDVGSVITSSRLSEPFEVGALDVYIRSDAITCVAWGQVTASPLHDALAAVARQVAREALHGCYRYRVVRMSGRRVDLAAVGGSAAGVPDLLTIPQWPGVAGVHADLVPGGQVLVQFVAGNRGDPVITSYIGNHEAVPSRLELGGPNGAPVNAQGDAVEVLLPPAVFSGTIGGVPASGVLAFPSMKALGVTTGGHPSVRVA